MDVKEIVNDSLTSYSILDEFFSAKINITSDDINFFRWLKRFRLD